MAIDATGTPSANYAIPKINPAVDAPSGNGFNAAMDVIDTQMKTIDNKAATGAAKPGLGIVIAMGG